MIHSLNVLWREGEVVSAAAMLSPVPVTTVLRGIQNTSLRVSAGFPSPAADEMESPVDLVAWMIRHEHATFWYRVSGSSLSKLGIMDGDLVAIDRAGKALPGRTVLALHGGDMVLKLLVKRDGCLWLEARSEERYPPIRVTDTVEIWGVVAAIARRYPVE